MTEKPEQITVRYIGNLVGHPRAGKTVTVDHTPEIDDAIRLGFAVEVEPAEVATETGDDGDQPAVVNSIGGATVVPDADGVVTLAPGTYHEDGAEADEQPAPDGQ